MAQPDQTDIALHSFPCLCLTSVSATPELALIKEEAEPSWDILPLKGYEARIDSAKLKLVLLQKLTVPRIWGEGWISMDRCGNNSVP